MKVKRVVPLVNIKNTYQDPRVQTALKLVREHIEHMENPSGSGLFHLNLTRNGNGVKSIKDTFMSSLTGDGWRLEARLNLGVTQKQPGPIDAVLELNDGSAKHIAIEWETGNISSSHRAVNKLISGILVGELLCGILVLPSKEMYKYLTDRVGNFDELSPYFPVWSMANYNIDEGCIVIIEVEHDVLTSNVATLSKGTDGRALR
jgi:hypothetical protein